MSHGLKSGAIFGSLFGTVLSLLSGVGILFVPFVVSVVAAGPLGAALLGATTGAIAGLAGAGLASTFATLGMPEDRAAIYETRLRAGEFLLVAEVPKEDQGAIRLLLESADGQEISICDAMIIPRQGDGKIERLEDLSPEVRSHLSESAQQTFKEAYNQALTHSRTASQAIIDAWQAVENHFNRDDQGYWSSPKSLK
jgi:cation transport regulator ChaB